ncbi:MAG: methyl-accepting chemotaxis protein [Firmicutes bacterium]|nr:methyl-accepting chemotaxis protein [Bacillota bacterium]
MDGRFDTRSVERLALSLTYGETGHAYLVDQRGTLAAYRDFAMVRDMQDIYNAPAVQKALKGEAGTELLQDPFAKKELLTSYTPVGKTGWGIIVVQDPEEAFAPVQAAMWRIIVFCVVLLLIAAVVAWVLAQTISRPVGNLARLAEQVAEGDLTVEITVNSHDEVGVLARAFGVMVDSTRSVVQDIMERANLVAASSQQLNASSEETAANANEAAATMNEMSATVEQVDTSIQEVETQSDRANEFARQGSEGMNRIIGQMQAIADSTTAVSTSIDDLNKKSNQISQIVSLITDIADQTNLLALNAAIEAARAGEQGRGFAVVAEEVRKLAEQSANAAQEIHALINDIQSESEKAVGIMAEGSEEVEAGTVVVDEVRDNFQEIMNSIHDVTTRVGEVVLATEQMTDGVQNIAASTEEQTAAMQEVSAAAGSLAQLSEELDNLVGRFRV